VRLKLDIPSFGPGCTDGQIFPPAFLISLLPCFRLFQIQVKKRITYRHSGPWPIHRSCLLASACYCPMEPFLWTRPPSKNRCCTMLWPSNRNRTAKNTANSSFAIPKDGGSCSGGCVGFESVVIGAASLPTQVAVVGQRSMIRYFPPRFKFLPAAVYPDGSLD
jgi:hypothetical protein